MKKGVHRRRGPGEPWVPQGRDVSEKVKPKRVL